jgi:hypothetical protein
MTTVSGSHTIEGAPGPSSDKHRPTPEADVTTHDSTHTQEPLEALAGKHKRTELQ